MTSPPRSVNCVKSGESELCLSFPKMIIHYAESRVCLLSESAARREHFEKSADPILSFLPSDWSNRRQILHNCNKSLYNELHHIFTTSLTAFSTSSKSKPTRPKIKSQKHDAKRGCGTNKIQCSRSFSSSVLRGKTCERKTEKGETDRQRESINKTWLHDFPTSKRRTQEGALPEQ